MTNPTNTQDEWLDVAKSLGMPDGSGITGLDYIKAIHPDTLAAIQAKIKQARVAGRIDAYYDIKTKGGTANAIRAYANDRLKQLKELE